MNNIARRAILLGTISITVVIFLAPISCYSTQIQEEGLGQISKYANQYSAHIQRRSSYQMESPQSSQDTFAAPKPGELPKHITPIQASEMLEQLPDSIVKELRVMYPGMSDVEIVETLMKMTEDDGISDFGTVSNEKSQTLPQPIPNNNQIIQNASGVKSYLARRKKMQEEYESRRRAQNGEHNSVPQTAAPIQYPPMLTSLLPLDFRHKYQANPTSSHPSQFYQKSAHPHHEGSPFKINLKHLDRPDPYYELITSHPGSNYPNSYQRSQINFPICLTRPNAKMGQVIPVDWENLPTMNDCLRAISNIKPQYQQEKLCKNNEAFLGQVKKTEVSVFNTCRIIVESKEGRANCPDLEIVKELAMRVAKQCVVGSAKGGRLGLGIRIPLTAGYVGMLQGRMAYFVKERRKRKDRGNGNSNENEQDEGRKRKEIKALGAVNRPQSKGEVVWDILKIRVERAERQF